MAIFKRKHICKKTIFHCYLYVSLPKCRFFFIVIPPNMGIFFFNPEHILNRGMLGEKFLTIKSTWYTDQVGRYFRFVKGLRPGKNRISMYPEKWLYGMIPLKKSWGNQVIPYNRLLPKKLPCQQTVTKDLGNTGSETFSGIGVLGAPDASGGQLGVGKHFLCLHMKMWKKGRVFSFNRPYLNISKTMSSLKNQFGSFDSKSGGRWFFSGFNNIFVHVVHCPELWAKIWQITSGHPNNSHHASGFVQPLLTQSNYALVNLHGNRRPKHRPFLMIWPWFGVGKKQWQTNP